MRDWLTRLQKCDPTTYGDYFDWIGSLKSGHGNAVSPDGELGKAILQAMLQDAITRCGWCWDVSNDDEWPGKYWAVIHNTGHLLSHESGTSPATAMLAAYLAAIEARP